MHPVRSLARKVGGQGCLARPSLAAGMTTASLAAALVIAFTCVLEASCLQRRNPEAEPAEGLAPTTGQTGEPSDPEHLGEAPQESSGGRRYGSKDFRFKVVVEDDGEGEAGGYQAADVSDAFSMLKLSGRGYRWECHYRVLMPIRAEHFGRITADRAALWSAEAANEVVFPLLARENWTGLGVLFCQDLNRLLAARLNAEHPRLGASVMKDQ